MTMQFLLKDDCFLRKERGAFVQRSADNEDYLASMPSDKVYQISHTAEAVCEAYYGKSVKLKFPDRTVATLSPDRRITSILSKSGDILEIQTLNPGIYHRYVQSALEFWDFVFKPAREKVADQL